MIGAQIDLDFPEWESVSLHYESLVSVDDKTGEPMRWHHRMFRHTAEKWLLEDAERHDVRAWIE